MDHITANAPEDRLLPFSDALKLVGISRSQVYLLQMRGDFPGATKIGRNNYYSERELRAWVQAQLDARGKAPKGSEQGALGETDKGKVESHG